MENKILLFGLFMVPLAGILMFAMLYSMAAGLNRKEDMKVFKKFIQFFCVLFFGVCLGLIIYVI